MFRCMHVKTAYFVATFQHVSFYFDRSFDASNYIFFFELWTTMLMRSFENGNRTSASGECIFSCCALFIFSWCNRLNGIDYAYRWKFKENAPFLLYIFDLKEKNWFFDKLCKNKAFFQQSFENRIYANVSFLWLTRKMHRKYCDLPSFRRQSSFFHQF